MNTFYKNFKSQLFIIVVLFGASFGFAQVVSVPANCRVVSTNTLLGGALGLGGKVTDGGVVIMPDPSGGGTFNFGAFGTNIIGPAVGWTLRGDLSTVNATSVVGNPTSFYNAAVQTATGSSTNIITYNKTLRPTENTTAQFPLNNPVWARSKGRVTVSYTIVNGTFSCGNSMTFEVFKTFTASPITNVPIIVGPDCVEAGKQCTFSVDQIASDNSNDNIGFDKYYWAGIPTGTGIQVNSLYYSADNSSVTFTPTTSAPINLTCCIGKANSSPWSDIANNGPLQSVGFTYSTCVSKIVGAAPSQPTYNPIVGPNNLCVPTGTTLLPASFTLNYTSTNTCTWTAANTGWTIGAQTASSVTINTNGFNNPGILTLTVSNGTCTPLTFQYQINRTFNSSIAIAPTNSTLTTSCLNIGSTSNTISGQNIFAISTSAAANPVTWSVTLASSTTAATGFSFTTQATASSIGLNVLATASVGSYELKATNSCGGILSYPFTVRPASVTINATSPTCVTRGGVPVTFTCTASTGATGYLWSFPTGWTTAATFTTTTNSIIVTPTSTAVAGNVTVTPQGAVTTCNGVVSVAYTVNFNAVAPTGITPSACVTVGSLSATLTVTNAQNFGTYTVTSTPVGVTGTITGSGVIPLTLPSSLVAGSYTLVVTHTNSSASPPIFNCGSASFNYTLTVGANLYSIVTLTSAPSDTFFISGAPTGAIYAWFVNNIPAATPPTPNQLVLTGAGTLPTSVYCLVTFNGCTTRMDASLLNVTHSQRISKNGFNSAINNITIYPNPSNGTFTIKIDTVKESATAILYDLNGRTIDTFTLKQGENTIVKEGLSRGYYIVSTTIDGVTSAQKIKVKN